MTLYVIAELREIRDPAKLSRYYREVRPLLAAHGGEILAVSGGDEEVIEGDDGPAIHSVQTWPSRAAFGEFWDSPEYCTVRELRREACESRIVVIEA